MSKTKIEWSEQTWNPVTGCTKISEGCQNCYAEKMHKRLQAMDLQTGKLKKYRQDFNCVKFHPEELNKNFGKKPKMIFVNSMADLFHKDIADIDIAHILEVITWNKQHIFQLLTKRAERLKSFNFLSKTNLWLGVTVELAKYKNRIEDLKRTDAKVKFISFEPLLGDVGELDLSGIDWVIVGGESGSNARPCHPQWIRNIHSQCIRQNIPFFFKQNGEYKGTTVYNFVDKSMTLCRKEFWLDFEGKILKTVEDFNEKQVSPTARMQKVSKKKAGCLLDGKEYKEYPRKAVLNGR